MGSRVFTYSMPAGIPGTLSRAAGQATVEAQILDTTDYPTEYGVAVTIDSVTHALRKIKAGDAVTAVTGIYVRPYPLQTSSNDALGTSTPPTSGIGNQLKRGYISVKLRGATAAAKQGTVYVRIANADADHPLGGFEAALVADETVALPGAYFTGPADADANVEIAYKI